MRAILQTRYGGPEVLELGEVPEPQVGPDSLLVDVRAAGVNPVDYKIREGYLDGAFASAFPLVLGWDVAGVVAAVGAAVGEWQPGDEVVGYLRKDWVQQGTYADRVAGQVRHWARKPSSAPFEEAAGLPLAGLTALQALLAVGIGDGAGRGDAVVVHAAAGGVGHLAVQLAVAAGARVVGTASERNHDFLRGLGAEPVTYGEGLEQRVRDLLGRPADAAVDLVGGDALAVSPSLVADPARVASVVDPAVREAGGRYVFVRPHAAQLGQLADLVDDGRLRVHVERAFPLAEAAQAQALLEQGHVRGKVVLVA